MNNKQKKDPPWLHAFEARKATYTESVTFYCPSKKRNSQDLWMTDVVKIVDGVMKYLLTQLGGATMTKGKGFFEDDKKEIHMEDVVICRSLCTKQKLQKEYRNIYYMANSLAVLFEQHSLAVEINGLMFFFSPSEIYGKNLREKYLKKWKSGKLAPLGYHAFFDRELIMAGAGE